MKHDHTSTKLYKKQFKEFLKLKITDNLQRLKHEIKNIVASILQNFYLIIQNTEFM